MRRYAVTKKVGIYLAMTLAFVAGFTACAQFGYDGVDIDTTRKAILVANAELQGANLLLSDVIDRDVLTEAQARSALANLRDAHENLQSGLDLVDTAEDPFTASTLLDRANASINLVILLLSEFIEEPQ